MANRHTISSLQQQPAPKPVRRSACVHRWVLGEPNEGRIHGRCRLCDATRIYPAVPEGNDRFDDYRELTAASSYHWARAERRSA
jgi:hypothetical protein